MFDIRLLRSDPDAVRDAMRKRRGNVDIDSILAIDGQRRTAIYELEQLRARQNKAGESIAACKRTGANADDVIAEMKSIKEQTAALEEQVREVDEKLQEVLLTLPNVPDETVPVGTDETANQVVRVVGSPPSVDFEPKDHVEIAEGLGIRLRAAPQNGWRRFTLSRVLARCLNSHSSTLFWIFTRRNTATRKSCRRLW